MHKSRITVREPYFEPDPDTPRYWYRNNPGVTHLFNATMIMFPEGEKYFINAVHQYRKSISDEQLSADIQAFTQQEINHSKAHNLFNELLQSQGYEVERLEDILSRGFKKTKNQLNKKQQLATVIAYEHFTAIFGDIVLSHPDWMDGVNPVFSDLLRWHAAEEIEHKSVAYNVYEAIGGDYPTRIIFMIISTLYFLKYQFHHMFLFLKRDGLHFNLKTWWSVFKFVFIKPGSFFQIAPLYLRYFSPWFHPDNHDNSELIDSWNNQFYSKRAQSL